MTVYTSTYLVRLSALPGKKLFNILNRFAFEVKTQFVFCDVGATFLHAPVNV